jgi:hypothetical protein
MGVQNVQKKLQIVGGEGREGAELSFQCLRPSTSLMAAGNKRKYSRKKFVQFLTPSKKLTDPSTFRLSSEKSLVLGSPLR